MTALARTEAPAHFLCAPHLDGRILTRARRCQGRTARLAALALASAALDSASHARATFTATQMRSFARLTKYSETLPLREIFRIQD